MWFVYEVGLLDGLNILRYQACKDIIDAMEIKEKWQNDKQFNIKTFITIHRF